MYDLNGECFEFVGFKKGDLRTFLVIFFLFRTTNESYGESTEESLFKSKESSQMYSWSRVKRARLSELCQILI